LEIIFDDKEVLLHIIREYLRINFKLKYTLDDMLPHFNFPEGKKIDE